MSYCTCSTNAGYIGLYIDYEQEAFQAAAAAIDEDGSNVEQIIQDLQLDLASMRTVFLGMMHTPNNCPNGGSPRT